MSDRCGAATALTEAIGRRVGAAPSDARRWFGRSATQRVAVTVGEAERMLNEHEAV